MGFQTTINKLLSREISRKIQISSIVGIVMAAMNGDLKSVLTEKLESAGVLNELRARIRAELLSAMEGKESKHPPLCNENLLINELIREYFQFNRYHCSTSVLVAESGQPKEPLDREFLCRELRISPDHGSKSLPLLYTMVSYFMAAESRPVDYLHHRQDPSHQQEGSDVDISSRTNSTMGGDDGCTIDERSGRTPDGDNARITDNITITHPVYIDQQ